MESPMDTRDAGGATRRCPQCRCYTLVFKDHYPVLATGISLERTGTDPHDGADRLRYAPAWVCENARCDYRELQER
jgi:hypothetical protein